MAVKLIEQAVEQGACCYKACDVIGISWRTYHRYRQTSGPVQDKRHEGAQKRVQSHALTEHEQKQILQVCNSSEYQNLPPSQIVPKLADGGCYIASESSFYRVLKKYQQLQRRGRARCPRKVSVPAPLCAQKPNQVWSWDITYLPTEVKGIYYRLYLIMDVYSRMIVAWEVHEEEDQDHSSQLIKQACLVHCVMLDQLTLHSDNGSVMKGATMLCTLQNLGVMPSFSRPGVSDDNPYSEALFRTLKYTPAYPEKAFKSIDDARRWVQRFESWYNTEHRHSGIKYVTPHLRHYMQDEAVLCKRKEVFEKAKQCNPARWGARKTRNWSHIKEVNLNPLKEHDPKQKRSKIKN